MQQNSSTLAYGVRGPAGASLAERWNHWWFAPETPVNLAVCRILFYGLLFAVVVCWPYASWATLPHSFFHPVWMFEFFHLPVLPYRVLIVAEIAWKVSLVTACLGLFTRASTWAATILGVYLVGLPYNYGKTDHMTAIILFTFGIMALSRCGDALSIDAIISRRRRPTEPPPAPSGEYRWPVRMAWVLMSTLFFAAGMAKVIHGRLAWVTSDNFAILLVQRHYLTSLPTLDWGIFIAHHPLLYKTAAAGSIAAELGLVLALFSRRLRAVLPWALLGMQVGIGLFMRVWFWPYFVCYLFWVPWDRVLLRRGARVANAAAPREPEPAYA